MHTKRRKIVHAATALILALAALPTMAAEGRIPIPFTTPVATPINITAPGKYILTRPLRATAAGPVINVAAGSTVGLYEVDIDLNGFTIDATPFAGAIGIRASSAVSATLEIAIRNGAIQGGGNGIVIAAAPSGAAIRKVVIENMRIGGTSSDAVVVNDAQNIVIRNNIIVDAAAGNIGPGAGILIPPAGGVIKQATIEGNLIRNTKDGINVTSAAASPASVAIFNNRLEMLTAGGALSGDAIHLEFANGCLVSENTIFQTGGGNGIRLINTNGCKLFDNVISRAAGHGISIDALSNDNLILRNVVRESINSGIYVAGDRNQIESNLLNSNSRGLTFDLPAGAVNNLYRGNTARGNTGTTACPGGGCGNDFCGFGSVTNHTQGDNFLPAIVAAPPACEK